MPDEDPPAAARKRRPALQGGRPPGEALELLRKPVNTLAIVPQSKRITPLFRKSYNVMLYLAQEQGLEKDIFRAPLSEVIRGLDFDSNDTALVKKHLRAMASTAVEWQSPTTGEGSSWAVSGLIGHAEIKRERGQVWLEWSYSVKLKQELLQPSVFARLSIEIISQLRSHGGIALYEICARYREVGRTARQPWGWWRPVLSGKPETDKTRKQEYRFFKRDVLKPAIAEVNAITDLTVELIEHKAGRFISDLQFRIAKKASSALPPRTPPLALDLSLVSRAQKLGIDDTRAEELLQEYGDAALEAGLDALEKRIASAYPEPLRDPGRYLKTLLSGEASRADKKLASPQPPAEDPPSAQQLKGLESRRHARWQEEWLRRRREGIISDLQSLSEEQQADIAASLLDDMEARKVHPSIRKRLQTSGWQHPMVLGEMVRFYAVASIGEHWDKPSPQQLLEVAAQLGDE